MRLNRLGLVTMLAMTLMASTASAQLQRVELKTLGMD
jgi:hypothetical protein